MSGIAVAFRRDGAPVTAADLEVMTAAMTHRATGGVRHEIDGPVGVGFCSMVTTPEEDRQPLRCRAGTTIVAMDGRLDDRATLRARLGRGTAAGTADADLLVGAVQRWGAGFVNRLLGDFAVVVADAAHRRVVCARDHLGAKPLYYASVGPLFVAASEVKAVLAHPAVPADLDPAAFEAWTEHWVVPEGTIYRSISSLPMGSILVVTVNGAVGPSRHWRPSCTPDPSLTPAALVEEYRWLVTEATRDRLRSRGPVVAAMSGGLDSTSVAVTALGLARQDPGAPPVQPASLVFPGYPLADESDLVDTMEATLGLPVRRVRPRARTPDELADEIDRYRELPDVPNDQLGHLVRPELGERVVLTGLGGDDWFYASPGLDVTRALRHGRLVTAYRAATCGTQDGRHPSGLRALWRYGVRPLPKVPGAVVGRSDLLARVVSTVGGALGARFLQASWCPPSVPLDTAPVLSWSRNPLLGSRLAVIERRAAHIGFEYRHPLHDVRLVELSLRMPPGLRLVEGDARWLPRRAFEGLLPDEVRLRRDKAEFSLPVREELEVAGDRRVTDRLPAAWHRDWLDIRTRDADAWHPHLSHLWSSVALLLWEDAQCTWSVAAGPIC